ncbi:probable RNA polymerase II nuclear localization protein SLC7A6OS [Sabethes cyaneus]|uniref:probable RNA polymerase II nuclear localization protein SLC7A6OS n=1 Tax=Sabethes cyaneus TaxID=53552 RepID=UPI00237D6B7B|nr:probable RNA polymerase II nuclear localization protein SLC7A6OS [Sabethes cyaneus]
MAAVIRLKRRADEAPLDAFVLNCKRRRTEHGNGLLNPAATGETSTVLKIAATFARADNISSHLQQRLTKSEAKEVISRVHHPTIVSRNWAAARRNARNNRFRIVNCTRSLHEADGGDGTTIVDVERDFVGSESAVARTGASRDEPNYVYDLYVADENKQQTQITYIPENLDDISVAIYDDPLYSSYRDGSGHGSFTHDEDSDDSNDEDNWRNDYPEEDADFFGEANSDGEKDIRRTVEDFDFEEDRELSPDEDDYTGHGNSSGFAYPANDDDENGEYCEEDSVGLNQNNVWAAYAKYKARVMKKMDKNDSDQYDSENDYSDGRSSAGDSSLSENFDLYD